MLHKAIQKALGLFGYRLERVRSPESVPADFPPEVVETIEAVRPFTMTSAERISSLVQGVEYVVRNRIPGDMVECGVWRGGSMMAVARTLIRLRSTDRQLFLFDTFEGMPPATDVDRDPSGKLASDLMAASDQQTSTIWARAQLEEVTRNVHSIGYPAGNIHFVRGKVEDTIPGNAPDKIALLRLDTDWYESTRHELIHLFPRLAVGGVLIIDDYGHWAGARKAVDEYIEERQLQILLCRIDDTGRIAIKQTS